MGKGWEYHLSLVKNSPFIRSHVLCYCLSQVALSHRSTDFHDIPGQTDRQTDRQRDRQIEGSMGKGWEYHLSLVKNSPFIRSHVLCYCFSQVTLSRRIAVLDISGQRDRQIDRQRDRQTEGSVGKGMGSITEVLMENPLSWDLISYVTVSLKLPCLIGALISMIYLVREADKLTDRETDR